MKNKRHIVKSVLLILGLFYSVQIYGQETDPARTVRNIRIRKLAQNWKGQDVTLVLIDGSELYGVLTDVTLEKFVLQREDSPINVPIENAKAVKLIPGAIEGFLVGFSGLLGSGLGMGIVTLTAPESNPGVVLAAGVCGAGTGAYWGYRTFYQEEIIVLD